MSLNLFKYDGVYIDVATGKANAWLPILEGDQADGSDAAPAVLLIGGPMQRSFYAVPSIPSGSTTATRAILSNDFITCTASGSCVLVIPTLASMGIIRPANKMLVIPYVTLGSGQLYLNAGSGVSITHAPGAAPEEQPQGLTRSLVSWVDNVWVTGS